jgi:hypothetical protein
MRPISIRADGAIRAADKPPFSLIGSLQGRNRTSISLLGYVASTIDELFCASAFIRGNFGTDIFL